MYESQHFQVKDILQKQEYDIQNTIQSKYILQTKYPQGKLLS